MSVLARGARLRPPERRRSLTFNHQVQQQVEVLETGQRLVLALQGEAYAPRLVPSNTALDFGECGQYERVELPLTLTNQAPLPVSVSFGRTANFTASPTSLTTLV